MSNWIPNRAESDGPGLHALIIGVSYYQFLPGENEFPPKDRITLGLRQVKTPATSALAFARWLRDQYWHPKVPLKSVRLLLSPSPEELAEIEGMNEASAAQPRATKEEVWKALQDWQKDCRGNPNNVAVLYASGHGIQWGSRDEAIVLLEDFSKDQLFLNYSIDIGGTLRGMSGSDMAQTQFYFVDACRVRPEAASDFDNAGQGLSLASKFKDRDLRSAPIFFAACPETTAKGLRGDGTYFGQALIECLNSLAQQGPDKTSVIEVEREYWHVSVSDILSHLQYRVSEIAQKDEETQEVVLGGQIRPAVFNALKSPPLVTVEVDVSPDEAAKVAEAELWSWNRDSRIKERTKCWEKPVELKDVPAGLYILDLHATAPYKSGNYAVQAKPPRWKETLILP